MIAAPVGVVSSWGTDVRTVGYPFSISTVAGAGMGIRPCCVLIKPPLPSRTGEEYTASIPHASRQIAHPTISTMESSAPTSWKCTLSGVVPWTRASASAMTRNIDRERSFTDGESAERSSISAMSLIFLWTCSPPVVTTSIWSASTALRLTWRAESSNPPLPSLPSSDWSDSNFTPALTNAAIVMSPAIPPTVSKYAIVIAFSGVSPRDVREIVQSRRCAIPQTLPRVPRTLASPRRPREGSGASCKAPRCFRRRIPPRIPQA